MYSVPVRELCEFAAKTGDLDHRFTPSPSAQDGIVGHQIVAARRGTGRRSEVSVGADYKLLRVRGRADGFNDVDGVLEEVKTYRGNLDNVPANRRALHLAQAKVYAALLCRQLGRPSLKVAVIYFEISRQAETVFVEDCSAGDLWSFFESLCDAFLAWATGELEHRRRRNDALSVLAFNHPAFRAGQRDLAVNVFRAARSGRHLMAQAPTGIGKTVATIYPFLKACATEGLDKIFFLTGKTSGQQLARAALADIRRSNPGLSLRTVEIVSRERACEHPGAACQGDSCPLARGFYDRMPAARLAAVSGDAVLDRVSVRELARQHQVCPYYLSQELVRWADVVIADYNYFFDSTAMLHALTLANEWKVGVLVDEAHNLLERARTMYSAELSAAAVDSALASAKATIRVPLLRLQQQLIDVSAGTARYSVEPEIPENLVDALGDATAAITEWLAEDAVDVHEAVLRFYFDALHFSRMVESFGKHSLFDVTRSGEGACLCIRNVVPASFLRQRYAATKSTVLFSATLSPQQFYADTLGLPDSTAWLDVASPFAAGQLEVHFADRISTRFADREASLRPIAELIEAQWEDRPGNYLAFFSSFDYMTRAERTLRSLRPDIPVWSQQQGGDDAARVAFLERFALDGRGVGFAVLGGSFAEGIDLPGTRLIGAFIATLGMPQVNPVNEEMSRRHEQLFGAGFDYTYLYPGLRKVVQAAGRVIRTTTDTGSLHLIDDRFRRSEVRAMLPAWWSA